MSDTLVKYDAALAGFDWFYDYSDDHRVWERGSAAHSKILAEAKASPQHRSLYDLWFRHHFTGKPWGTEEFTKAELDVERAKILEGPKP